MEVIGADAQIATPDLHEAMERALSERAGKQVLIVRVERKPSTFQSSYAVEELKVELADGTRLEIIFKNLSPRAELENAHEIRPAFLRNPKREIQTYRHILAPAGLGTPECYGSSTDEASGRYWLFLENIPGRHLWQFGDFELWLESARWLARMHARFSRPMNGLFKKAPLLQYDRSFYGTWIERACDFVIAAENVSDDQRKRLVQLRTNYHRVIDRLASIKTTFVHGEFYASNVLIEQTPTGPRTRPIDWEMAGIAPGAIDLAALTAGKWTGEQKDAFAIEYHKALSADGIACSFEAFMTELNHCRLHLAVQWLGWSSHWTPPKAHAQDWLGESLLLAERLGLLG